MNVETLQELILLYLYTQKSSYLSNVQVVKHTSDLLVKYTSLYFKFDYYNIEIRIYNNSFIKIRVDDNPGIVCNDISGVRSYIDRLSYDR
jgi:hypothetical protein